MISLTGKITIGTLILALLIWIISLVVCDVTWYLIGLVFGTALYILDISVITHDKSWPWQISSISQLIKGKSRDLQKLLKYFDGATTSAFNLFPLFGVLSIIFALYLKD